MRPLGWRTGMSDELFSVPLFNRGRDRILSSLVKMIVRTTNPADIPDRFLPGSTSYRILEKFGRLYGFETSQVVNVLQEAAGRRAFFNLLRSISEHGIGVPQVMNAPMSVVWSLSYRCNLRCKHCYQDASKPSSDELTLEEQLRVVDEMAQAGVSMIVLSGGEPLTNPNLQKLIERIRAYEISISIDSNGVLITRDLVNSLKELGVSSIELSLDSVRPESHDQFRGLKGAFEKTLDAVRMCSDAAMFTTIATTATKLNCVESRQLISLAKNSGADRVVFFDLIPAGRGKDIGELSLSRDQLLDLMSLVKESSSSDGIEVFTELPQFAVYSSNGNGCSASAQTRRAVSIDRLTVSTFFDCAGEDNIYRRFAPYLGGCPAGRLYCNIQPNGNVTPCMFMPEYPVAGNLRHQSFEEIWNSPTFESLRDRTRLQGKCRGCEHAITCGGCRAKAAAYCGDYLASDPTCPIQN